MIYLDVGVDEFPELSDELALALPPVGGQGQLAQLLVLSQLPHWKGNQQVRVQVQGAEVHQTLKQKTFFQHKKLFYTVF